MAGVKMYATALILTALIGILLIQAGILIAVDNNPAQSIGNHPILNDFVADINYSLGNFEDESNDTLTGISKSSTTISSGAVIIDAISNTWKIIIKSPIVIYNTLKFLAYDVLGGGSYLLIVFGVLSGLLIVSIVLAVWRLIYTGRDD